MPAGVDRLTNTIKLGTHYAMMLNSRDDINQIINNIARQKEIESIRIYNKEGEIKYSNRSAEIDTTTNIKDEACYICHRLNRRCRRSAWRKERGYSTPPKATGCLELSARSAMSRDVPPMPVTFIRPARKFWAHLDVVVSLEDTDKEIFLTEKAAVGLAGAIFLVTSAIIFLFQLRFVNQPIRKLIDGTRSHRQGGVSQQGGYRPGR